MSEEDDIREALNLHDNQWWEPEVTASDRIGVYNLTISQGMLSLMRFDSTIYASGRNPEKLLRKGQKVADKLNAALRWQREHEEAARQATEHQKLVAMAETEGRRRKKMGL